MTYYQGSELYIEWAWGPVGPPLKTHSPALSHRIRSLEPSLKPPNLKLSSSSNLARLEILLSSLSQTARDGQTVQALKLSNPAGKTFSTATAPLKKHVVAARTPGIP